MSFRVETNVMVPMRDGVELATDLWIPDQRPAPALLLRLPYGKNAQLGLYDNPLIPYFSKLLDAGYAMVWQDCRGTYDSGGEFVPMVNEADDGVDTITWLARQPWCDGTVGTYGASYLGMVQWVSAPDAPKELKALATTMTSSDQYAAPWYCEGGAMSWHTVWSWATEMALVDAQRALDAGAGDADTATAFAEMLAEPQKHLDLPPAEQDAVAKYWPWWSEWLRHPARDRFWQDQAVTDNAATITVPSLNVGGWFDLFVSDTVRTYVRMKAEAGTEDARDGQQLIIGPWDHLCVDGVYPDRQFGMNGHSLAADITGAHVKFFDRWVRGKADALDGTALVRIFVMGIDEWRDEQDWPLPDTEYVDYYLDGSGNANTAGGNGILATARPGVKYTDTYTYDPAKPVPTVGGRLIGPAATKIAGPADQSEVERREDVLCFTTPVLEEPLEVTGHVSLVLFASSSARDTDFTGKLVDVFPDGRAIYLTDGVLRARYRESLAEPESLEPGQVYELTLDLSVTSNVFLPGHRIRLEVSSSNFPRYDRNTNTGGVIADEKAADFVVATNAVFRGPGHPSRLILPIIRR